MADQGGRDVPVVAQMAQYAGLPGTHGQPVRHDRIVGEDVESHLTTQLPNEPGFSAAPISHQPGGPDQLFVSNAHDPNPASGTVSECGRDANPAYRTSDGPLVVMLAAAAAPPGRAHPTGTS